MIDRVIKTVTDELIAYLDLIGGLEEPATNIVEISHLFNSSGEPIPTELGVTLVNIEEDRINRAIDPYLKTESGVTRVNPELKLNLFVLFSANFDSNYSEALKFISYVVRFFQSKNVFTTENTPALDADVKKLIVELHPMSFEQQNYLWGMVGGKYLPSALYKFRLLVVQENMATEGVSEIEEINENIS
ncbi:MAG: DUF4255 domain-containing protein [Crocinitomix sp.]|nr:DUF4255 domain-containing protein [Crocinitomix sp.]